MPNTMRMTSRESISTAEGLLVWDTAVAGVTGQAEARGEAAGDDAPHGRGHHQAASPQCAPPAAPAAAVSSPIDHHSPSALFPEEPKNRGSEVWRACQLGPSSHATFVPDSPVLPNMLQGLFACAGAKFPLEQVKEAIKTAKEKSGKSGKVMLEG